MFTGRLALVAQSFGEAVEAEIDSLAAPWADLPGGLRAGFFPTPALTAIDLDGASASAARGEKARLQFAANRGALPALARQIRLRNLSGAIVVDFAGVAGKRRASLGPELAQCLAADPVQPRLLGFTQLGLAEILRSRTSPPLHEVLAGPHAAGLAGLRALACSDRAGAGRRPCLRAAPDVITALQADSVALDEFAQVSAHRLILQSDPSLPTATCITEYL
jgi:Rne/Rng family ribonuclease